MTDLISKGKPIHKIEDAKIAAISQDNNEDNKECEENSKPLHHKK